MEKCFDWFGICYCLGYLYCNFISFKNQIDNNEKQLILVHSQYEGGFFYAKKYQFCCILVYYLVFRIFGQFLMPDNNRKARMLENPSFFLLCNFT